MIMDQLHKKPTFDQLINYIDHQPKIKYPDRRATFLRNSHVLGQFDGDSWIDLEEQENKILKEKLIQEAIQTMSRTSGLTHATLQARARNSTDPFESDSDRPSYLVPPSEYESGQSDFTGYADSEIERREVHKRARSALLAERATQDLQEHIKATSEGLYADSEKLSEKSVLSDLIKETKAKDQAKQILSKVFDTGVKNVVRKELLQEQASSSTSKPVYTEALPKTRGRSTSRPGTKRESDNPEDIPRRIRSKSQPPIQTIPEKRGPGRPPQTEEQKRAIAEAKAKEKAEAKNKSKKNK